MTIDRVLQKYREHPDFLGTSLTGVNQRGAVDDTPLHIACRKGDLDDISFMVQSGGDIDLPGDLGNTPLHFAAMFGKFEAVKKLLELGANKAARNEFGQTPREVAELGGHVNVASIL